MVSCEEKTWSAVGENRLQSFVVLTILTGVKFYVVIDFLSQLECCKVILKLLPLSSAENVLLRHIFLL